MEDDRLNRNLEELLSKNGQEHRKVIDRLTELDKEGKLVNFLKDSKIPIISCPAISSNGLEDSYSLAIDLLKRICDVIYLKHRDFNKFKKVYDLYLNYYLASREVIFDVHELGHALDRIMGLETMLDDKSSAIYKIFEKDMPHLEEHFKTPSEHFAFIFQNYYEEDFEKKEFKKKFPEAYEFLRKLEALVIEGLSNEKPKAE